MRNGAVCDGTTVSLYEHLERLAGNEADKLARARSFNDFDGIMIHQYAYSLLREAIATRAALASPEART